MEDRAAELVEDVGLGGPWGPRVVIAHGFGGEAGGFGLRKGVEGADVEEAALDGDADGVAAAVVLTVGNTTESAGVVPVIAGSHAFGSFSQSMKLKEVSARR